MHGTVAAGFGAGLWLALSAATPPPPSVETAVPPTFGFCVASGAAEVFASDVFEVDPSASLDGLTARWSAYVTAMGGATPTCALTQDGKFAAYAQLDSSAEDAARTLRQSEQLGSVNIRRTGWLGR